MTSMPPASTVSSTVIAAKTTKRKPLTDLAKDAPAKLLRPSRPEAMDGEAKDRGRRMLGMVMGTLRRFDTESRNPNAGAQRRREVEEKLQARLAQEKRELLPLLSSTQGANELLAVGSEAYKARETVLTTQRSTRWKQHQEQLKTWEKTNALPILYYRRQQPLDTSRSTMVDDQ
ncbi:hypothetical protein H4R34_004307 [Dimargaris verticillata]|uniref:Pinin/SDK/MemA protein domain-containing protein n=1 Tax=Dimargaris verticillata TaxID=2761393 RepID=A0A9W8AYH1_9FUNG|nr:hypothetical protein H4R34_004307 [Dimargaris verticillata]